MDNTNLQIAMKRIAEARAEIVKAQELADEAYEQLWDEGRFAKLEQCHNCMHRDYTGYCCKFNMHTDEHDFCSWWVEDEY